MPPLNDFYANDDTKEDMSDVRWNVLAWLLSISDAQKDALKSCDKYFRTACATLLALVQVINLNIVSNFLHSQLCTKFVFQEDIFSIEAADSILVAEKMGRDNRVPYESMVETLNADHMQTAQCYKSCYVNVSLAFKIAGLDDLLSVIKCNSQPNSVLNFIFVLYHFVTETIEIRHHFLPKLDGNQTN